LASAGVNCSDVNNVASVTSKFPSDPDLHDNTDDAGIDVRPGAAKLSLTKRHRPHEGAVPDAGRPVIQRDRS
jgi:hypothetical protein